MSQPTRRTFDVSYPSDVSAARKMVRAIATEIGFKDRESEEIVLVVSELAANIVKHAKGGTLTVTPLSDEGRIGIQIESNDYGPGIVDIDQAMEDGYSTSGSLGYGLGTVHRLMGEMQIESLPGGGRGTHIVCRRWIQSIERSIKPCLLSFGAATRLHPAMTVNGDAFIVKKWAESALVGVIDGLGHGELAHRAAQTARQFIEAHFDQPLEAIFGGVGRACHSTRGVVMALARFDWAYAKLTFASVGNVRVRAFSGHAPMRFTERRGIIGYNAPRPIVTEHEWEPGNIMLLHTDGMRSTWRMEDFPEVSQISASALAHLLLSRFAKHDDDATVVVVKSASL